MLKPILFIIAGLALAITLVTFGANNISKPNNLYVAVGVAEVLLSLALLAIVIRFALKNIFTITK